MAGILLGMDASYAWTPTSSSSKKNSGRSIFGGNGNSLTYSSSSSVLHASTGGSDYSSIEASLFGTKPAVEAVSASASSSADAAVTGDSLSSLFAPIQATLEKIIETERALNNMEHTAVSNAAKILLSFLRGIDDISESITTTAISAIPTDTMSTIISTSIDTAKTYATSVDDALLSNPMIGPVLQAIQSKALELSPIIGEEIGNLPPSVGILASAGITYGIISTTLSIGEGPPPSSPYPLGRYDPSSARAYFDQRPAEVLGRGIEIAAQSTQFGLRLLGDYLGNKLEENADARALELAELLTRLGPTFSKYN